MWAYRWSWKKLLTKSEQPPLWVVQAAIPVA
jgi:hypothetical protein